MRVRSILPITRMKKGNVEKLEEGELKQFEIKRKFKTMYELLLNVSPKCLVEILEAHRVRAKETDDIGIMSGAIVNKMINHGLLELVSRLDLDRLTSILKHLKVQPKETWEDCKFQFLQCVHQYTHVASFLATLTDEMVFELIVAMGYDPFPNIQRNLRDGALNELIFLEGAIYVFNEMANEFLSELATELKIEVTESDLDHHILLLIISQVYPHVYLDRVDSDHWFDHEDLKKRRSKWNGELVPEIKFGITAKTLTTYFWEDHMTSWLKNRRLKSTGTLEQKVARILAYLEQGIGDISFKTGSKKKGKVVRKLVEKVDKITEE